MSQSKRPFTHDMDAVDAAMFEARSHKVIRAAIGRNGWEGVSDETPLDELMAREGDGGEICEEEQIRQEAVRRVLGWIFGKGPNPGDVMRRLYALAYQLDHSLLANMPMDDIRLLLDETKAAFSWRVRQLFKGTLHSRSQKREGARSAYAKSARGNKNRRLGELRKKREKQNGN